MAAHAADRVWQTSHLGGHRFAPTLLCLPYGDQYGRLGIGQGTALIDAYDRGDLYDLDYYRGRTALSGPAQAAEILLRRQTGIMTAGALTLRSFHDLGDDRYHADFEFSGAAYDIGMVRSQGATAVRGSCAKEKLSPVWHYSPV